MSIEVKSISKSYKDQFALKDINFKIHKGEIVGLLGPNGAGKSTLMKILTGFISASSGEANINGKKLTEAKTDIQRQIGYLPEHNPIYLEMYVKEYLHFHARIFKSKKERIEKVIEQTKLTEEVDKRIYQLSKGYRQRVGLAAALLHDPSVLILDEPTTGLDPNQLIEIRELITSISKEKTILLSTHIMQEVEAICDRVIIINKGQIVSDKKLSDLNDPEQQVIEVEFNYRIEEVALKEIGKVINIKNLTRFRYEITFNTPLDKRPDIFDFAYDKGLKILELHKKNKNLESLFIDLTKDN
ncbi:gliding motility associated ATP-binding protein GldA [Psychroflexus gondwanensis ACAM 44]|jgi:ABC-2 type transport system ATP-binding protein|uniref:Gliding motility associated ATP-binding protein GldA n=1 Tax=Psychroflexus gondwanensis ACAM 44 TaxID=1189619 RepID=N1WRS5_9FLAO|nr:gliding motility-associated ABC transporter ATP-binding subunit GldA [Psychroflexus gondwanensis]EMY81715.1 gliding motility associated ATP-binding protein GldA [Psychroflexus gondwanensis ACAM 44]